MPNPHKVKLPLDTNFGAMALEGQKHLQELQDAIWKKRIEFLKLALKTRIQEIEGRLPTEAEIRRHGWHGIWPDGREEFKWKGKTIVTIDGRNQGEAFSKTFTLPAINIVREPEVPNQNG